MPAQAPQEYHLGGDHLQESIHCASNLCGVPQADLPDRYPVAQGQQLPHLGLFHLLILHGSIADQTYGLSPILLINSMSGPEAITESLELRLTHDITGSLQGHPLDHGPRCSGFGGIHENTVFPVLFTDGEDGVLMYSTDSRT